MRLRRAFGYSAGVSVLVVSALAGQAYATESQTFYSPLTSVQPGKTVWVTATCPLSLKTDGPGGFQATGLDYVAQTTTIRQFSVELENISQQPGQAMSFVNCVS